MYYSIKRYLLLWHNNIVSLRLDVCSISAHATGPQHSCSTCDDDWLQQQATSRSATWELFLGKSHMNENRQVTLQWQTICTWQNPTFWSKCLTSGVFLFWTLIIIMFSIPFLFFTLFVGGFYIAYNVSLSTYQLLAYYFILIYRFITGRFPLKRC